MSGAAWSWRDWAMVAALALATAALFSPALAFGFVDYDDNHYVTYNPIVQQGFRPATLRYIFSHPMIANYHPLTMASHALDWQLYRADPRGHHRTSILLHAANAALVFAWLRASTGRYWAAALAAALFACHPLRVESVVWIAERKDVLSSFFGLAALLTYTAYARRSPADPLRLVGVDGSTFGVRLAWYAATCLLLAAGLLSKPMLVTFPFVLLLLDFWPLERWKPGEGFGRAARLVAEKAPFFLLAVALSVITYLVQADAGATRQEEVFPLSHRMLNAVLSYGAYISQTLWPAGLAVLYPLEGKQLDLIETAIVAVGLLSVTVWAALSYRWRPYLPVGWFWFLGTLVPVIGLVQVGEQAHADRYTYWPHIGLFLAVAWLVAESAEQAARAGRKWAIPAASAACCGAILALALVTLGQERHWRDTESLFRHTLAVTKNNYIAELSLGNGYIERAKLASAERRYEEQFDWLRQAEAAFRRGLEMKPEYYKLHRNLGQALMLQGRYDEAAQHYQRALARHTADASLHYALGLMLLHNKQYTAAESSFREALRRPNPPIDAVIGLTSALIAQGRWAEALAPLEGVGGYPLAQAQKARILAAAPEVSRQRPAEALSLARAADLATKSSDSRILDALGVALAANGDFASAAIISKRALAIAERLALIDRSGNWREVAAEIRQRLELYEQKKPYLLPAVKG